MLSPNAENNGKCEKEEEKVLSIDEKGSNRWKTEQFRDIGLFE